MLKGGPMGLGRLVAPFIPHAPPHLESGLEMRADILQKDNRTLELRHFFPLPDPGEENATYEYDVYLYFPVSFGVSPDAWTRDDFYRAARIFMRLHAPLLTLADLSNLESPSSPAALLRRQLNQLLEPRVPSATTMSALAHMFGAELADRVEFQANQVRKLAAQDSGDGRSHLFSQLDAFCTDVLLALGTLRRLQAKALANAAIAPPNLLTSLAQAEEYASAMVDEALAGLALHLEGISHLRDGTALASRLRLLLGRTVEAVNHRRLDQGYAVPSSTSERQGEWFTYRLVTLRRELQRALFVDSRALQRDPFYRNSAAAVGAAIAATWATLAQIQLFQQGITNPNSLLFVGAAVGAYILKDRLKEWVRNFLSDYLLRWDHDQALANQTLEQLGLGSFDGRARERMSFVPEARLPAEVRDLRAFCHSMKGLDSEKEHVVHYHRQLVLEPRAGQHLPAGYGIRELFRLSLDPLLKRLDEPRDELAFYEPMRGRFEKVVLPRVYHLNIVLISKDLAGKQRLIQGGRLVVDRKRIRRLELLVSRREALKDKK